MNRRVVFQSAVRLKLSVVSITVAEYFSPPDSIRLKISEWFVHLVIRSYVKLTQFNEVINLNPFFFHLSLFFDEIIQKRFLVFHQLQSWKFLSVYSGWSEKCYTVKTEEKPLENSFVVGKIAEKVRRKDLASNEFLFKGNYSDFNWLKCVGIKKKD